MKRNILLAFTFLISTQITTLASSIRLIHPDSTLPYDQNYSFLGYTEGNQSVTYYNKAANRLYDAYVSKYNISDLKRVYPYRGSLTSTFIYNGNIYTFSMWVMHEGYESSWIDAEMRIISKAPIALTSTYTPSPPTPPPVTYITLKANMGVQSNILQNLDSSKKISLPANFSNVGTLGSIRLTKK